MSAINKELYDALLEGNISEKTAAKAARSVLNEKLADRIEALERRMSAVETRLAVVETKLETITRLLWILVAGVAGILIKTVLA